MKKKLTKTLALGLSLAAALTLTTGCGKKDDTTSDTPAPAVTSESSSDNSGSETAAGTIDYTICPWVFSRALSDEETLELPAGTGMYGLTFPVTVDELKSIPYVASSVPLADALTESAYANTFYNDDDYSCPMLCIDEDDMTIGDALDKNLWSLANSYCDYDSLGISEDAYNAVYNSYDNPQRAYMFMDMLTAIYGAPNYVSFSGNYEENTSYFVNKFLHPEKDDYQLSGSSMYIGWQFEDFGFAIQFFDAFGYSETAGYYTSPDNDMDFFYIPIEKGTLEEYFTTTFENVSGANIVKELMAEKTALFGDVEYLTADEKIVELVNSAKGNASATDADAANE